MTVTGLTAAPVLETQRLRLRGRTLDDFSFINAMWADPEVTRYIGGKPRSEEDNWTKFLRMMGHWPAMGFGYWIVEEKDTGALLGEAGFGEFKRDMKPSIKGEPELGYAFAACAHGKGYGSETIAAVVAWGDEHLDGVRMSCIIDLENLASIRVAEKCGFVKTGRAIYHGDEILLLHRASGS
ncbi:MAG: GNAT family N-acetyltransferase [Pseudomonadota bacterium]